MKINDPSKTFKDYIDIYNNNILDERIKNLCNAFGCDSKLVKSAIRYRRKDEEVKKIIERLKDTIDCDKAKTALEKIEKKEIPMRNVIALSKKKIKEFILQGGFDL